MGLILSVASGFFFEASALFFPPPSIPFLTPTPLSPFIPATDDELYNQFENSGKNTLLHIQYSISP